MKQNSQENINTKDPQQALQSVCDLLRAVKQRPSWQETQQDKEKDYRGTALNLSLSSTVLFSVTYLM